MNFLRMKSRFLGLSLVAVSSAMISQSAYAFSTWSYSIVGVANRDYGGYIGNLDSDYDTDGSLSVASFSTSFTGMDGNGDQQTMGFTGLTKTQSSFGMLHSYAAGSVTNSYYNASNPYYYNSNTNDFNTSGTPDTLVSLGFAGFNDTLHFGGQLQAGYRARYIFHVDGWNNGFGTVADLSVNIAGNDESFFAFDPGFVDTIWTTQSYEINGITPQTINVQFSNQFVLDTYNVADGTNASGVSDFSSTLRLQGIEVLDAAGNPVSGWTLESDSGTQYNGIGAVPEPCSVIALTTGAIGMLLRRRKRSA